MMTNISFKVATAIVSLFSLADTTVEAAPIRIGLSLGLTGKYAPMSEMQEKAFRLWETRVNERGGILRRKVRLTIYDDQSNEEIAKKLYHRFVDQEKMDLLFPPYSSGLTAAIVPITEKHGYPLLASGASADSIWTQGYRYIFGVYSPASRYTLGFLELAVHSGLARLAIVSADDTFSNNLAIGTKMWAERLGIEVVLHKTIKKGTSQLDAVAQAAMDSQAQLLVMCGHFDEAINMRQALKNVRWYPQMFYASVGPTIPAYHEQLGKDAERVFSSTQWMYHKKLRYPGGEDFRQRFRATYAVEPSYHAAAAYAACLLMESAIKKSGSLDRKKVRNILANLDTMTLLGRYGVDRTGMQVRHFNLIIQWINGRQEVVWPLELRTADPTVYRPSPAAMDAPR